MLKKDLVEKIKEIQKESGKQRPMIQFDFLERGREKSETFRGSYAGTVDLLMMVRCGKAFLNFRIPHIVPDSLKWLKEDDLPKKEKRPKPLRKKTKGESIRRDKNKLNKDMVIATLKLIKKEMRGKKGCVIQFKRVSGINEDVVRHRGVFINSDDSSIAICKHVNKDEARKLSDINDIPVRGVIPHSIKLLDNIALLDIINKQEAILAELKGIMFRNNVAVKKLIGKFSRI